MTNLICELQAKLLDIREWVKGVMRFEDNLINIISIITSFTLNDYC